MSLRIYCQSCGNPTDYLSTKPKFCSHCANPFESSGHAKSSFTPPTPKPLVNKAKVVIKDVDQIDPIDDDDDTSKDATSVPQLDSLDVEIEIGRNRRETLKDLAQNKPSRGLIRNLQGGEKMSKEKFLEEWKKEAGTLKDEK